MMRSPYYDKNGIKRGAWSKEEDESLRAYVERYGHRNWRQLPKHAGLSRCGKSCRLRWLNHLRPGVKHGNYTQEEDELIIKLHQQLGNKRSLIAERLPGRSDNEIKNRWHSHLKKQLEGNQADKFELRTNSSCTCERETTKHFEPENPLLGFVAASSANVLESSPIEESSDANNAAREIVEEFGDFGTQPLVPENIYDQDNYYSLNFATNEADVDEFYFLFLINNSEFLYQVMQGFPEDPKKDM